MEKFSENWKKYPLLVVGDPVPALSGVLQISHLSLGPESATNLDAATNINNSYVLLHLPLAEIREALAQLAKLGVNSDQVIVAIPADIPYSLSDFPFCGAFDLIEFESSEEFRARFLYKLDVQRQKRLPFALQRAIDLGLSRSLNDRELQRTLDTTRFAHTLCCAYDLPYQPHASALLACWESTANFSAEGWSPDRSIEFLLVQAAALVIDCLANGTPVREALRERAAALPYRVRTDLFHQVENCLALLTGGRSHAA